MSNRPDRGIAVDASMRSGKVGGTTGLVEWRAVDIATGEELMRSRVYPGGTCSMGELMAIYDGIHWALHNNYDGPIYSDSIVALTWAKKGECTADLPVDESSLELWQAIWSDQGWAEAEEVRRRINSDLRQWMTKQWGENPADLGYKSYVKKMAYAVRVGRIPGVYKTWKECSDQVTGFPGCQFKGFPSEREAIEYLASAPQDPSSRATSLLDTFTEEGRASGSHITTCRKEKCLHPTCYCS